MWYSQIEVSIGRSLKKAKGGKEEEEEKENKLFMAFRRKANKFFAPKTVLRACPVKD